MNITIHDKDTHSIKKYKLNDNEIINSPFLKTMRDTNVGTKKDDYEINSSLDDIININLFDNYLEFLKGEDFDMNICDENFFDFMGHPNLMEYPLDYWKIKLHDNWVRDNFYRMKLYENPLYDLIEIKLSDFDSIESTLDERAMDSKYYKAEKDRYNKHNYKVNKYYDYQQILNDIPSGAYIAGGFLLEILGITNKSSDIDIFFTSKETFYDMITMKNYYGYPILSENSVSFRKGERKYQLILRLYKSPSEIVHGFDLDCVGVLYYNHKFYATKRTYYSIKNKINFFDPDRASPSYYYRLNKYKMRGFDIILPQFNEEFIDQNSLDIFSRKIFKIGFKIVNQIYKDDYYSFGHDCSSDCSFDIVMNFLKLYKDTQKYVNSSTIEIIYRYFDGCDSESKVLNRIISFIMKNKDKFPKDYKNFVSVMPKDGLSIIILLKFRNIMTSYWKQLDYDSEHHISHSNNRKNIDCLTWKEQNPMEQITSTFRPEPISNLKDFYNRSIFYKDYSNRSEDIHSSQTDEI